MSLAAGSSHPLGASVAHVFEGLALLALIVGARPFMSVVGRARGWLFPTVPDGIVREAVETSADWHLDAQSADELLLISARRLLDTQISANDILDARATTILGSASTVLPVTIGLLNLLSPGQHLPGVTKALIVAAIAAYVLLVLATLISFRTQGLGFRPHIEDLRTLTKTTPGGAVRRWISEEYILSIQRNRPLQQRKSRATGIAFGCLCVESVALALSALATFV